ncbi:MoaD/ThiS family protein [Geomonas azotofigens]|uniref:MoaD/ThiS family protein n=1 Tax=Geomonas azotofigens TaxID=2843196 RepID=UPI001C0F71D7|nr:MoaD/ThiS family protein [Geomonas azotofigens]MBU5614792.1 MoaD/ThiS family protein [Geomonas azotofigens]
MKITLKLFATFRNGRFKIAEQELAEGTEVRQVVLGLGLTEEEIGIVMLNGRHGELDSKLANGDTLSLFPLVGGG